MPENETHVFPFRGLRYDVSKNCPPDQVTAPPFDAIDKPLQKALYEQHPNNVVRLDLNQITPEDSPQNNAYTRAKTYFQQWQVDGILVPEEQPAIYVYRQQWEDEAGKTIERKGVWLLLELEHYDAKRVIPHENTLIGPKSDRMNLLKMTLGNFSPIFMAYTDPDCKLERTLFNTDAASQVITDKDGITHTITPIFDTNLIEKVQKLIKNQRLLIADGHHRYETAVAFMEDARDRYRKLYGEAPPKGSLLSDYTMVYLANINNPGLKVYPTHRLLDHWPGDLDQEAFEKQLFEHFDIVETGGCFIYTRNKQLPLHLKLKPSEDLSLLPKELQGLDTAILEHVVFKGILNATTVELKANRMIGFSTDAGQVQQALENGHAVAAFLMGTPDLALIKEACETGLRMPLKSTYFYPKLLNGLVFYSYRAFLNQAQPTHALTGAVPSVVPLPDGAFSLEKDGIDYKMALIPD